VLLIAGLFTRFAAFAGALMMGLFFVATWDFSHGIVNEQLMYGIVTGVLGVVAAGRYYGLDAVLEKAATIRRAPQLRYVMGCAVSGAEAEPPRSHPRKRAFGPALVLSANAGTSFAAPVPGRCDQWPLGCGTFRRGSVGWRSRG